jgi:hypothetical protein
MNVKPIKLYLVYAYTRCMYNVIEKGRNYISLSGDRLSVLLLTLENKLEIKVVYLDLICVSCSWLHSSWFFVQTISRSRVWKQQFKFILFYKL